MKKGLLLLIILTVLGCNEDPELKEHSEIKEDNKTVEFRFQQGKLDRNMLRTFMSRVEPDYAKYYLILNLDSSTSLILDNLDVDAEADKTVSWLNKLSKGMHNVILQYPKDEKSNIFITIIVE